MILILFGPPGVGKGTQAKILSGEMKIAHIATGDILRDAISHATEMGKKAKLYMDRGELVPDDVVIGIIRERLREKDAKNGFILDGFPRTLPQAEALDKVFGEFSIKVDHVISMEVDEQLLVSRLTSRRVCRKCGSIFNLLVDRLEDSVCPKCGGELYQRDDDREDTIKHRFEVYQTQTRPVKDYYRQRNMLVEIDGMGEIDVITGRLKKILK